MARGTGAAPRGPRIHPLVPALVAVVVGGVLVLVVASISDDDPAPVATDTTAATTTTAFPPITTATTTPPDPVSVQSLLGGALPVDEPLTYRITYDVVENGLAREETVTVRRPYESLVLSTRDGSQLSGTATSRAGLHTYLADRSGWLTVQPELHRAAFDLRPAGSVGALEALGYARERETDERAGRACTVYRTGQPTSSGEPTPPSDEETTDLCIDEAGLVLWEQWRLDGNPVIERTARTVEVGVDVEPSSFDPTPEIEDAEAFDEAFTSIAVEADEETLERLRTTFEAPGGYTYDGAVFRAGTPRSSENSSEIVRFYSDGPDLLELSEHFVDRPTQLGGGAAVPVEVDGWDEVWFVPGFRTSAVRARLSETSYVELRHHDVSFLFRSLDDLTLVAS